MESKIIYDNYILSNNGDCYSIKKNIFINKKHNEKTGYDFYILSVNKKPKPISIHRLVAEAFIPNPENKPQVNHINKIKTDNRVENLNWMTRKENINHSKEEFIKAGIERRGKKNKKIKPKLYNYRYEVIHMNYKYEVINIFKDRYEACDILNIPISTLTNNCNKKRNLYSVVSNVKKMSYKLYYKGILIENDIKTKDMKIKYPDLDCSIKRNQDPKIYFTDILKYGEKKKIINDLV